MSPAAHPASSSSSVPRPAIRSAADVIQYEKSLDCVHCGLCLASCPTYELTGRETASPRGRIYLMRGLAEGEIEPTDKVTRELDLCLVCRACEPVCPSGVQFGELMEFTRTSVLEPARRGSLGVRLKRLALRHLLPFPRRVRVFTALLALNEWIGLRALLRRFGVLRYLSPSIALRDELLPSIPPRHQRRRLDKQTLSGMGHRGRVAVLEGCVMPLLLGATNRATVRVLSQQGFEVAVPAEDVCCGALCSHFGQQDVARVTARRVVAAFAKLGPVDAVVVNSAGCGAAMKEYGRLLEEAPGIPDAEVHAARAFAAKVKDVSEFLVEKGLRPPPGRVEARVAYADACHLAHAQGIREAPRRLLEAIPGVTQVPLPRSDRCCGAAGLYNVLQPEASAQLLEGKMADLAKTGATVIATGNPGCILQYRAGVRRAGLDIEVVHPVELFARALDASPET